ncbi:MAG: DNA-directed RNA polymerase subunit omega [Bacteroidia bacterium]|nr:DNA-directed RNA polymerase subunit omega [Bacteroidia bacterium]
MTDIKSKVQGIDPNISARNIKDLIAETGNIYESLAIISKRARQVSVDVKRELHQKLEEFAVTTDTIEEVHENKEQIEISKFYERLPNPVIISMTEYLEDELNHRYKGDGSEGYDDDVSGGLMGLEEM